MNSNIWWNGPDFLREPNQNWDAAIASAPPDIVPEQRKSQTSTLIASAESSMLTRIQRSHNSFLKLQTALAYVCRWIHNTRNPTKKFTGPLSAEESIIGLSKLLQIVQMESFPSEYRGLIKPNYVVRDPKLKSLALFMGDDKLIRVGGRLKFATMSYSSKHPILLPSHHFVSIALVNFLHKSNLHVGPIRLLAIVRQTYWPINGKRLINKVYRQCVMCARAIPRLMQQRMGDLPKERVNSAFPFQFVGIDYCGPFMIHYSLRGKVPTKAYLAVFVCLATRAIHLELSSDLSTSAFIGALRRFIATRGLPKKIISDNGTNFIEISAVLISHLDAVEPLRSSRPGECLS